LLRLPRVGGGPAGRPAIVWIPAFAGTTNLGVPAFAGMTNMIRARDILRHQLDAVVIVSPPGRLEQRRKHGLPATQVQDARAFGNQLLAQQVLENGIAPELAGGEA